MGAVKGVVLVLNQDGKSQAPDSATVYLIYCDPAGRGADSPCIAFEKAQANAMKAAADETSKHKSEYAKQPLEQRNNEFAKYFVGTVDQALKAAAEWAEKKQKQWTMISVSAASDGSWSRDGLHVGYYMIVARGKMRNMDCDWEGKDEIEVKAGETNLVTLDRPRVVWTMP